MSGALNGLGPPDPGRGAANAPDSRHPHREYGLSWDNESRRWVTTIRTSRGGSWR